MNITAEEDSFLNRLISAVGYIGFLGVIALFLKRKEPSCVFHGKQGLVIFFFWAVILYLGWIIGWPALLLAPILFFVNVFAIWQAFKGRNWRIPVIGKIAEKIGYAS